MNVASPAPDASQASAPPQVAPPADDSALSPERPFPGLRPFAFADREFFFGRERQAFALYRLVENGRFIAVIGSSGSGKSSLVLAGLCGLLAEESADPGGPTWICLDMRPGAVPLARLARTLARLSGNDSPDEAARRRDRIEYRLRQSSFSFESALEEAGGLGGRSLLLIVDQFEELFRFGLAGLGLRQAGLEEARARDEATQFVQILLDADRRRLRNVRALITVRSDFIGDCAYFPGLSEAVSATQYLVPNLNRSQLEDAIRKPIEKAGATIEPELVERLINDCGDELDQLPVLQHCLMRLWDRAGPASGDAPRSLTRQTYDEIGRMTEALSRHADEILRQCGDKLAVEQAFRALSELDREGRAIRRALPFKKLLAETGVAESDLRGALDRFRAPTCSFLVPPPSGAPTLAPDDRVDIGHETLLRRWKKLAGDAEGVEAVTGKPAAGWLADEQSDGQHYRMLASLLEGEAGGEKATLRNAEQTKQWWDRLPRTPAWAERYGGEFARVKALIVDSLATKRRSRRNAFLFAGVLVLAFLGAGGYIAQLLSEKRAKEAADVESIVSASKWLQRILDLQDSGSLSLESLRSLAEISEGFARDIRANQPGGTTDFAWVGFLIRDSDLNAKIGDARKSLKLAREAQGIAAPRAKAQPNDPTVQQQFYDVTIRVGNTLALSPNGRQQGLEQYQEAMNIAKAVAATNDSEQFEIDILDAHMKVGDIYYIQRTPSRALDEYKAGLADFERALEKFPEADVLRNRGKAYYRIAETLRSWRSWDEAETYYRRAADDQQALVEKRPKDLTLKSNLAATYNHWGLLAKDKGDFAGALSKLESGIGLQEQLVRNDPGNPQWQVFLAPNYRYAAEILDKLDRNEDALEYLQRLLDIRNRLAARDPANLRQQLEYVAAAKAYGDRAVGPAQIQAYREAVRTWDRIAELPNSESSLAPHYDDLIGFARAFEASKDWSDAQLAYGVAKRMAGVNLASDPSNAGWRDKADQAGKGAEAAKSALGPPSSAPAPAASPAATPASN